MRNIVNITFVARKRDRTKGQPRTAESLVSLTCRIEVRGQRERAQFDTGHETTLGNWQPASSMGRTLGKTPADRHINAQLTKLIDQLNDIHADLERQRRPVTARAIVRLYQSNGSVLNLTELYTAFLEERRGLVGIEIALATARTEASRYNKLLAFLAAHRLNSLRPEEFNHSMADKLLYWLLKNEGFKRGVANKHVQGVAQVLTWGVRREHLDRSPLTGYSFRHTAPGEIKYLTTGELADLTNARHLPEYLARVRDCFVFQCWTGLAYADLAALDTAKSVEYYTDKHGIVRRMLRITRQKSTMQHGYECVIPLLPEAERLLGQYADKLPVPSNQKYNAYLKELGKLCAISADKMTTHVGRKTAGTLMLNMGVTLSVVSKFLGHANTHITQKLYAKLLDSSVTDGFSQLFGMQPAEPIDERWLRPSPTTSRLTA